jgi:hypothetical protein
MTGWKIILIAAIVVVLTFVYVVHIRKDMSDFGVCYRGGERIVRGETLYRASDGHLQFKYAPASALAFVALSVLPYGAAQAIWYLLSLLSLFVVVRTGLDLLPPTRLRRGLLLALALLVIAKYLARELELGQVNLFILLLMALMTTALVRDRQVPAGLAAGLSLLFKPYALVFIPYFLVKKKWKALAGAGGAIAAGFVLPMIVYGPAGNLAIHREWVSSLRVSTRDLLTVGDNASFFAFLAKNLGFLGSGAAATLTAAVALGLAVLMLALIRTGRPVRTARPEGLEIAFLAVLIPMLSPLGWVYNYLYGFWAILFLIAGLDVLPRIARCVFVLNLALIGLTIVEIIGRPAFEFYTHRSLAAVNFLVVLGGLAWLRLKGRA